MPVTDTYRLQLLRTFENATPDTRATLTAELEHQRHMETVYIRTEQWTLVAAGVVVLLVLGLAAWFVTQGAEIAAALAVLSDVTGVVTLLIRRSYFISNTQAPQPDPA